jgi:hypothetical protein
MFPVLIIAYVNYNNVVARIKELRSLGFESISIFVDGFTENANSLKAGDRKKLVDYISQEFAALRIKRAFFNESNLGLGVAVPRAIDWFFEGEEYGLILEDDCSLQSYAKPFLNQCEQLITLNPDAVICLSNPHSNAAEFEHKSNMFFIPSNFFSSWGWICHREVWKTISIRKIELAEVLYAARQIQTISSIEKFWLALSWMDVWLTLRANQHRLWAFRFTILLIIFGVRIYYPSVKLVQHLPDACSTNVTNRPTWDEKQDLKSIPRIPSKPYKVLDVNWLDGYIAKKVQGAECRGLIIRLVYRLITKLKSNNRITY